MTAGISMRGIAYRRLKAIGHILYDEYRHCLASLIIDPFIIMVLVQPSHVVGLAILDMP
jgi:hypothetical protein